MPTTTTTYSFNKPVVGADEDDWGGYLNGNWDSVDDLLDGTTPVTGIDINSGTLDGVTIGGTTAGAGTFTTLTANTSITGTLATAAQPNITSVGTLTGLTVSASASLAGASTSADITFGDNDKAIFGAGSDLQIYHETSTGNSRIVESGTGHLNIEAANLNLKTPTGENYINCNENGNVLLRYDNAQKLATTSTGIDVTGTVNSDAFSLNAGSQVSSVGTFYLDIDSDNNSTGAALNITSDNKAKFLARFQEGGDISFYEDTGTTAKFFWDASAETLGLGGAPNSSGFPSIDISDAAFVGTTTDINIASNAYYNSGWKHSNAAVSGRYTISADTHRFYTAAAGTADGAITWSERMRIDSSGHVGIGRSAPSHPLHIGDTSGDTILELQRTNTNSSGTFGAISFTASDDHSVAAIHASADGDNEGAHLIFRTTSAASQNNYFNSTSEAMRIDSSGKLLVSTSSAYGDNGTTILGGEIYSRKTSSRILTLDRRTTDGEIVQFRKDGTTVGSIGSYSGAYVTFGSSDTGLVFVHGNDTIRPFNPSAGAERDNAIDMGSAGTRFDDIYATNGTIQTSDEREKQDIAELTDAEQRVAVAAKGLLRKFRWKDAVAEKGDEARTHFGIIAQDLQAAFAAEGLDAGDYAMFIHSTWTDEETGEERSRMGVRYSELLAFIIAAI